MSAITMYDYLAHSVPAKCQDLLDRYDVPASSNLKQFVRVYGQDALEELADIHPDKDLITEMAQLSTPYNGNKESEYLNATGDNRIDSIENRLNFGGDNSISKTDVLLGLGVAILTASFFKN